MSRIPVLDRLDSPYARKARAGKTIHIVEHRRDHGGGAFIALGTFEFEPRRLKNAPPVVVSRINWPSRSEPGLAWRRRGSAVVCDGVDQRTIQRRVNLLVAQLERGENPFDAPKPPRKGDRSAEARALRDLILARLATPRYWIPASVWSHPYVPIEKRWNLVLEVYDPRTGMQLEGSSAISCSVWFRRRDTVLGPFRPDPDGYLRTRIPVGMWSYRVRDRAGNLLQTGKDETREVVHTKLLDRATPWDDYIVQRDEAARCGRRPSLKWARGFTREIVFGGKPRQRGATGLTGIVRDRPFRTPKALAEAFAAQVLVVSERSVRRAL